MKKFMKIFTVLLAFVMVFSVSAACSCSDNPSKEDPDAPKVTGVIVENGASDYKIVISKKYTEAVYFAATEMQSFIDQATGVKLPITLDTAAVLNEDSRFISIGQTTVLEEIDGDVDYSALKEDGFIVRTKWDCLFINGACDRATLYGVYDYLEKFVGVKFLASDCTYVPTLDRLDFYSMRSTEIPAFPIRMFLTKQVYNDPLLNARMRLSAGEFFNAEEKYGGGTVFNGYIHNTLSFVPTIEYFYTEDDKEKNAHMYSLDDSGNPIDICFTDGVAEDGSLDESMEISVAKVALETLKENVRNSKTGSNFYFFTMQDTVKECQCSRCLERRKKYLSSGNVVRLTNLLAKEINEWSKKEYDGREIKLIMFAYNNTIYAPVDDEGNALDPTCVPNEYVHIRIATMNQNHYYSITEDKNFALGKTIEGWGNLTPNIMIWNYHTFYASFCWYFPTSRAWIADLKVYQEMGASYMLMQSDHINLNDWQDKMDLYVASKVMWNPDSDITALQNEFIELYYGSSADAVKEVTGRLDEKIYEISLTGEVNFGVYQPKVYDSKYYPIEFLEGLANIIDAEIEKAKDAGDDALVSRLKAVKLTPLYMIVKNVKSYYADSEIVNKLVKEFVEIAEELDFKNIDEGKRLDDLKNEYGL